MTDLPVEQPAGYVEIAYQQQETALADLMAEQLYGFTEVSYQKQETREEDIYVSHEPLVKRVIKVSIKPKSFGGSAVDVKIYIDGVGYISNMGFGIDDDGSPYGLFIVDDYCGSTITRVLLRHTGSGWSDPTTVKIYDYSSGTLLYSASITGHVWDTSLPYYSEYVKINWVINCNSIGYSTLGAIFTLRNVINILSFVFGGKAYVFDGSSVSEFPSHGEAVIFPLLAFGEDKIAVYGGLKEDGTIPNDIYVYGQDSYVIDVAKDSVALIIAGEEPVYVYDSEGNVKSKVTTIATLPVLAGWRIASRKPFIAMLMTV